MAVSPQALRTQSVAGQDFVDSVNPATGEVVARIPATPLSAIPAIFETARAAQKEWAAKPLRERCAMLRKLRDAIFERRDDIAEHRHSRNRQAARRSHTRRSASRARHRELPRAPGAAMAAPGTRPASQHRAESKIRLARIRAAWRRRNHFALEFPVRDSDDGIDSGSRRWQLRAAEALGTHARHRRAGRRTHRSRRFSERSGADPARWRRSSAPRSSKRGQRRCSSPEASPPDAESRKHAQAN